MGIVSGNAGSQPMKVYPSRVGLAGGVITVPLSWVILSTEVPPLLSNVMVNVSTIDHLKVKVSFTERD